MAQRRSPDSYPSVVILHSGGCEKAVFWAVDMPGLKTDIKNALYRAAQNGEEVRRLAPGETAEWGFCMCEWPKAEAAVPS